MQVFKYICLHEKIFMGQKTDTVNRSSPQWNKAVVASWYGSAWIAVDGEVDGTKYIEIKDEKLQNI